MRKTVKTFVLAAMIASCSAASAQPLKLVSTYIDHGFNGDGTLIPAGTNTPIGPVISVNCPTGDTCTIQADHFIQVGLGSVTGNQLAVGFYLDGSPVLDGQIVCSTPSDGTYLVCSTSELQSGVTAGKHTVQILVSSKYQTYVFNYNTNFRVFAQ